MDVTLSNRHLTMATVGGVIGIVASGSTILGAINAHSKVEMEQIQEAQHERDTINARLDRLQDALRIVASDNATQRDLINSMFNSAQQTASMAYKTQEKVAVISADAVLKAANSGVSADQPLPIEPVEEPPR